jgi:hypothetical protein
MIKGIIPNGRYVTVTGDVGTTPYISPGAVGAGMLRWNSNTSCMEVSDGTGWQTLSMAYVSVSLTPEAESLLDWARQKRDEDLKLVAMMEQYPALTKAKENFELVLNLIKDNYKENK